MRWRCRLLPASVGLVTPRAGWICILKRRKTHCLAADTIGTVRCSGGPGKRIGRRANHFSDLSPLASMPCLSFTHASRRLPKLREATEGRLNLSSYFAARSNKRLLVNGSAFSARLRQRSACSLRKAISMGLSLVPLISYLQIASGRLVSSPSPRKRRSRQVARRAYEQCEPQQGPWSFLAPKPSRQ